MCYYYSIITMLSAKIKEFGCKYILPICVSGLISLATCKEHNNVNKISNNKTISNSETKKNSSKNLLYYEKEPLKSDIETLSQDYVDSNTGKRYVFKRSKFENFGEQEFRQPDTGEEITFKAGVNIHGNSLKDVNLEITTDGENYKIYTMSLIDNNYEKKITFDDGAKVGARVRVRYHDSADVVEDYGDFWLYLSEADGQKALEKVVEDWYKLRKRHGTAKPSAIDTDYIENIKGFKIKFDKILRFKNSGSWPGEIYERRYFSNGILKHEKKHCSNDILLILEYISRSNDLIVNGQLVDPYEEIRPNKLTVRDILREARQCPGDNNYKDGKIKGIDSLFIYYNSYPDPTIPINKKAIAFFMEQFLLNHEVSYDIIDNYLDPIKERFIFIKP